MSKAPKTKRITEVEPEPQHDASRNGNAAMEEAQRRAQACNDEIAAVLKRHNCRIVAQLAPTLEPVGIHGDRGIVAIAGYGVLPLPKD